MAEFVCTVWASPNFFFQQVTSGERAMWVGDGAGERATERRAGDGAGERAMSGR